MTDGAGTGRADGGPGAAGALRATLLSGGALAAVLLLLAGGVCDGGTDIVNGLRHPEPGEDGVSVDELTGDELRVVARNLDTPWEVRFLPGGDLLVTERRGRLLRIAPAAGGPGEVVETHEIEGVVEEGEGGLMGMALHPDFPATPRIFLCHTARGGAGLENRLVRYRYENGQLSGRTVLLPGIPGAAVHDGCRLEFGPDGFLYLSMGDASQSQLAQERGSLAGKILRLTGEGEAAPDNPFGTRVWTLGHRNPEGLAFDGEGRLWATEHGSSAHDELNLIRAGENYGWPRITGDETGEGFVTPVLHSGPSTWAPSGLAHAGDGLFFGGLRGRALFEVRGIGAVEGVEPGASPEAGSLRLIAHFRGELGRLRPARSGPDGRIYFATSNRDGRGSPAETDDRIFSVDPERLGQAP